jgi:hypothetical protein
MNDIRERVSKHHHRKRFEAFDAPLDPRERIRSQWESVNYLRHGLEDMDRSVRIALIVFSVVNAGVAVLGARASAVAEFSFLARLVMAALAAVYVVILLGILSQSLRALRAQFSGRELEGLLRACGAAAPATSGVLFTLFPLSESTTPRDPDDYRRAWSRLTSEQLSAELADTCLLYTQVIQVKQRALNLIYRGLGLMVIVAVMALLAFTAVATGSI